MATVSTEYKQAFLEVIADSATASSATLLATLKAARSGRLTDTQTGKVIVGVAGNGKSITIATPTSGSEFTPVRAAELCQELINRYRAALAYLGGTPTDAEILTEMLAMLQIVDEASTDFSSMRCS